MELTCPKCQASMRSYERNGVTIDQCSECRGLFLDRGELEKLVDAENSYYDAGRQEPAPQAAPAAPTPPATQPFPQYDQVPPQAAPYQQQGYQQQGYRRYGSAGSPDSPSFFGGGQHQYGQRRRKSFLGELFD